MTTDTPIPLDRQHDHRQSESPRTNSGDGGIRHVKPLNSLFLQRLTVSESRIMAVQLGGPSWRS